MEQCRQCGSIQCRRYARVPKTTSMQQCPRNLVKCGRQSDVGNISPRTRLTMSRSLKTDVSDNLQTGKIRVSRQATETFNDLACAQFRYVHLRIPPSVLRNHEPSKWEGCWFANWRCVRPTCTCTCRSQVVECFISLPVFSPIKCDRTF